MQSNHFSTPGISCMLSVARIPWLGSSFTGFIAGIRLHDRLLQFNTYNLSTPHKLEISTDRVELIIEIRHHRPEIRGLRDAATSLASPVQGFMDGRIQESRLQV
jgi:hypothetical protein